MSRLKSVVYNCRKATFLIDKKMNGKISFRESMELRIHLLGCDVCSLYVKQSGKIDEMIKALLKTPTQSGLRLGDSFKNGMQAEIEEQLNKK